MNPFKDLEKKEEKTEKKEAVQSSQPTILVSHTDAYIHERMKAQPKSLEEIELKVVETIAPNKHRLSLPDAIKEYENRFTFRWIFKHKQAIDRACNVTGWVLVNRAYFPELPNHLFTVNGSIEEGDNILAFMKRDRAEMLRKQPGIDSHRMVQARFEAHKGDPNFYVPTDEEDSKVIGI